MAKLGFDLILLGAPAAGKDTQADLLMRKYLLKPVESGKYWRKMSKQKNSIGKLLRQTFSKGHATPVSLMKKFLSDQLKNIPANRNLIFIGNPRLKPEAQLLKKLLSDKGRDFCVISITLPEAEMKKRSLLRLRDDQDWKYIDNRIKMYKLQVKKTLNYFKTLGKLSTIDGNKTIKEVNREIEQAIHDYQRRKANSHIKTKRENSR